jgi:hypothetical protein
MAFDRRPPPEYGIRNHLYGGGNRGLGGDRFRPVYHRFHERYLRRQRPHRIYGREQRVADIDAFGRRHDPLERRVGCFAIFERRGRADRVL